MMERMFTGEGKERTFDKLAWARNELRRGHTDPVVMHIARKFLKEANLSEPPVDGDGFRRYKKLVVTEFWNQHSLEITTELDRRFSNEPDPKRPIIPPSTEPGSDRSFARFVVTSEIADAASVVAQRLVKEPYGPMGIELLNEGYWTELENRVRSQLHPISVRKSKPITVHATRVEVEGVDYPRGGKPSWESPAAEMSSERMAQAFERPESLAPETAPVQSKTDEAARLQSLFE